MRACACLPSVLRIFQQALSQWRQLPLQAAGISHAALVDTIIMQ